MRDFLRLFIREPVNDSRFDQAVHTGSVRADQGMIENKPKEVYLGLFQASISGGRYLAGRSVREFCHGDPVTAIITGSEAGVLYFTAAATSLLAVGEAVSEVCGLRRYSP